MFLTVALCGKRHVSILCRELFSLRWSLSNLTYKSWQFGGRHSTAMSGMHNSSHVENFPQCFQDGYATTLGLYSASSASIVGILWHMRIFSINDRS